MKTTRSIGTALTLVLSFWANAEARVATNGGLLVEDAEGKFAFSVNGRLMWDADSFDGVLNQDNGGDRRFNAHLRRARLELGGTAYEDFNFYFHVDYVDSTSEAEVHTAGIEYTGFDAFDVFVGRTKEPFGLEELSSSKSLSSIERNYFTEATTADSQPYYGIRLDGRVGKVGWSAGLFNPNGNPKHEDGGDRIAFTGRLFGAPIDTETSTLHLGAAYTDRNVRDPIELNGFRLDIAESGGALDSGRIQTDGIAATGIEALYIAGPFSLQSEYFVIDFDGADGGPDGEDRAYYVQATWTVTGERRGYKAGSGIPDIIKPSGPRGAVELVAKWDDIRFDVDGRPEQKVTGALLGVNWYVNRNVKLMFNYIDVTSDNLVGAGDDSADVFSARVQFAF